VISIFPFSLDLISIKSKYIIIKYLNKKIKKPRKNIRENMTEIEKMEKTRK
jgi:hypothetical protein